MKHVWRALALFSLSVLAVGCSTSQQQAPGAPTIEAAVRQVITCNPQQDDWRIRQVRPRQGGVIVLFTLICPPEPGFSKPFPRIGFLLLEQDQGLWVRRAYSDFGYADSPPPEQLISKSTIRELGTDKSPPFTITYGQALKPGVEVVEATLDNGVIVRDQVKDGVFAIITDESTQVRKIRVLGSGGQLLMVDE